MAWWYSDLVLLLEIKYLSVVIIALFQSAIMSQKKAKLDIQSEIGIA